MKLRAVVAVGVLAGASLWVTNQVWSQDKTDKADEGTPTGHPDPAAIMAEWMKLAEPGEHHKQLDRFVGTWNLVTKMWMDPSKPPSESKGTSTIKWIMGGRFLSEEVASVMDMGPMGKKSFEGFGLTGYDNIRNLYTSCWIDNMGTQMMTSKGTRHPHTGLFTYYGEMDEPGLKMYGRTVKWRIRFISDDKFVGEMFDLAAGENYKVFEILYERAA